MYINFLNLFPDNQYLSKKKKKNCQEPYSSTGWHLLMFSK